jgi:hypothetical protein
MKQAAFAYDKACQVAKQITAEDAEPLSSWYCAPLFPQKRTFIHQREAT